MNSPFDAHTNRELVSLEETEQLSKSQLEKSSVLQPIRTAAHDETEYHKKQAQNDFDVSNLEANWDAMPGALTEAPIKDLPAEPLDQDRIEQNEINVVQKASQKNLLKKMLVVDDLPVNRKLISFQLRKMGYEIDIADNGQDAVNKVRQETFALVFMDLEMPVMDGYQAAIQIRQYDLETRQHTPIIALSSYYRQTDKERCISSGMDHLISKGLGGRKFQETVQQYIRQPEDLPASYRSKPKKEKPPGAEIDFQLLHDTHGKLDEEVVDLALGSIKTFIGCLKCALEDRHLLNINHFADALHGPCTVLGLKSMNRLVTRILSNVAKSNWQAATQGMALLESQYSQILDQLTGLSAALHGIVEKQKD